MKVASPGRGSKHNFQTTIREIIQLRVAGKLVDYEHNRGNTGVLKHNVNKIAEDFDPLFLGTFSVAVRPDGVLTLVDAHSRTYAIMKLYNDGNKYLRSIMDSTTPRISVDVYHYSDRIKVYGKLNEVTPHTAIQNMTNPDYAIGGVWKTLEGSFKLPDKLAPSIMNVAMAIEHFGEHNFTLLDLAIPRRELDRLQKHVGKHPFSAVTLDALSRGLLQLTVLRQHILQEGTVTAKGSISSAAKSLLANASFNLGVLVGLTGSKKLDFSNPRGMAMKAIRYSESLTRCSNTFMKKGKELIEDTKFYLMLTPKKKRSKVKGLAAV